MLLVLSLVPLGFALWLALSPVENPGVQDCGSPVAFVAQNRTNVRLPRIGDPDYTPDTPRLNDQPRCTERVDERLGTVAAWGAAFVGTALLGAVLGLIDDRLRLRREPRFEELLREAPADAPQPGWDQPVIPMEDLGRELPDVEGEDVEALFVWGVVGSIVVPAVVAGREVLDVVDRLQFVPVLVAVLLGLLLPVLAAAPLMAAADSRIAFQRATAVAVAGGYLTRVMPAFGWSGVQAHVLARAGVPAADARRRAGLAVVVAGAVVAVAFVVGWLILVTSGEGDWPPRALLLVLGIAIGLSAGIGLLPVRYRRLVFPLDRSLLQEWSSLARRPLSLAALIGGAIAQPLVVGLALVFAVEACGGEASALAVLGVAWFALGLGAVVPTPGGLPVVEAATVVALALVGVDPAVAAAATVVWRLATYWLALLPGAVATRRLSRAGAL